MTQRRRVKGDKPYRFLLEQYPPAKKRRFHWFTRRLSDFEVEYLSRSRQFGESTFQGVGPNRITGEFNAAKVREKFYRFTTTPNWAGNTEALRGANRAMIEAEQSMNRSKRAA